LIEQYENDLCYLHFQHFQHFPELTHGVFTRRGGYSPVPYDGLNTSSSRIGEPRDSVENVVRNRQLALQALGLQDAPTVTLWQVHSANVVVFNAEDEWRTDWAFHSYYERSWNPTAIRKADALITRERGVALSLSFADCTPIMLYDPHEQVIGIAHGGWRGTARGIVFAMIAAMHERFGCQSAHIRAGIGPAIGACCYEVSEDVREHFLGMAEFADMPVDRRYRSLVCESAVFSTIASPGGKSLRLDLWETNRNQLLMAGLHPEHVEVAEICTRCHTDQFFSHRGEQGKTGRFPVVMALH
jgi:YfiH family protein